eukprot:Rhum_TRINITY_DN14558_c11_g1::Rhum_TRINITY_DN14558_c11_g1_i1::g.101669::m.101669
MSEPAFDPKQSNAPISPLRAKSTQKKQKQKQKTEEAGGECDAYYSTCCVHEPSKKKKRNGSKASEDTERAILGTRTVVCSPLHPPSFFPPPPLFTPQRFPHRPKLCYGDEQHCPTPVALRVRERRCAGCLFSMFRLPLAIAITSYTHTHTRSAFFRASCLLLHTIPYHNHTRQNPFLSSSSLRFYAPPCAPPPPRTECNAPHRVFSTPPPRLSKEPTEPERRVKVKPKQRQHQQIQNARQNTTLANPPPPPHTPPPLPSCATGGPTPELSDYLSTSFTPPPPPHVISPAAHMRTRMHARTQPSPPLPPHTHTFLPSFPPKGKARTGKNYPFPERVCSKTP